MPVRQPKVFARIAELPLAELMRLEKVELSNRTRGRQMRVPVSAVSIMGLWLLQRQTCGCLDKCGRALNPRAKHGDPDHIVFMHLHPMSAKGGSHSPQNCALGWAECNSKSARQEWSDVSKGRRMEPDHSTKALPPEDRALKEGRVSGGGQRLQGRNTLSREARAKAKEWKEKMEAARNG